MRVEVLDGSERRRRWSLADKARIVKETLAPGGEGDGGCAPQWRCGGRQAPTPERVVPCFAPQIAAAVETASEDDRLMRQLYRPPGTD
jgi:hypothetical protein